MPEQQIQFRRGTTTQWSTSNPVLLSGELAFDTTTGTFKIGNGTSTWTVLSAYSGGSADPEAIRDTIAAALSGAGLVSVTPNDGADTIVISTTATANDTDANLKNRTNHTGTQSADTLTDGSTNRLFTSAEKTKLTGVATAATANSTDAQLRDRTTHTGTQSADSIIDGTTNKAYTATEKTKLGGISAGATSNASDAILLARASHTGTQSADTVVDGTTNKVLTAAASTKLTGIATGATANDTDANLKNRANHTGSQAISTVTNLQTTLDSKVDSSDIDNIVVLTAAAYAALGTKDARTFYLQVG